MFGFPKNVVLLGFVSMFSDISTEMIYPLIPIFLNTVLHASFPFIGLIEGIAESAAALTRAISGWLSDKLQKRKFLIFTGYSLAAIAKPFLAVTTTWWQVLIIRFLDRSGKGIRTAPRDALIADSSDPKEMGRSFGFHRSLDTTGAVIGPLLALLILAFFTSNLRYIFLLSIIPGLISIFLIKFVAEKRSSRADGPLPTLSLSQFDIRFKLFLVVIAIFSIGNSSDAFLILRAQNVGVVIALVPAVYVLANIVYVLLSTPIGILSDKFGRKRMIFLGFLTFSLIYLGFALVRNTNLVWLLFAGYGLYFAFTEGVIRAFTADLVPNHLLGTAYGILNTLIGIFVLPASVLAGFLWEYVNPSAPFFFGSATSFISLILLLLFFGNKSIIAKINPLHQRISN